MWGNWDGSKIKDSIARFDNGAYTGVGSPFADFYQELWDAYWTIGSSYPCDFLPVNPDGTMPAPTP